MTPNGILLGYGAALDPRTQEQASASLYEPLKTQLDASAFDRLFQYMDASDKSGPPMPNYGDGFETKPEVSTEDLSMLPDASDRSPVMRLQPIGGELAKSHESGVATESITSEVSDRDVEPSGSLQSPGLWLVEVGENPDGDSKMPLTVSGMAGEADNPTLPTVVVGMDGEQARIWIRDTGVGLKKDQLIAKIRAELSWAGIAVGSITINGERVFRKFEASQLNPR